MLRLLSNEVADFPSANPLSNLFLIWIEKSKNLYPLGFAKTQLHDTYIISENEKGIIIIDQHAAHERIVYEKLKKEFYSKNVKRQILLIPLIIELDNLVLKNVEETIKNAEKYGVKVETFGSKYLIVREVPMILANSDVKKLVMDLIDGLIETNDIDSIEEKINKICSSMACHGSIRAGRIMEIDEMNDLLRKMAFSGQCNHGRPTYVELKLNDIEKLFGRKWFIVLKKSKMMTLKHFLSWEVLKHPNI